MLSAKRFGLLCCFLILPFWAKAETFYYKVYFGLIPVGLAKVKIICDKKRDLCELKSYAKTTGFVDLFYSVRDKFRSLLPGDLKSFSLYEAKIKEGRYKRRDKIIYDRTRQILIYYKNSKLKRKAKVKGPVYDPLSAYYVFSTFVKKGNLKSLENFKCAVTTGKKEVIPKIIFLGHDKVKTGCGIKESLKFSLAVKAKGLLMARDEKKPVKIWLAQSDGYLVKALIPTKWGNIKIILFKLDI